MATNRSLHRVTHDAHASIQRIALELRSRASALPNIIRVDISKVPDWQRRATRLSIAVAFFGILGHCVNFGPEHAALASNFRQSCNWAAITCIVVTAPVIGKVAQVAFDRLLGTAIGGFIGFACFTAGYRLFGSVGGPFFISLMSGVTVWGTTFLAFRHSLDQLARFMQLTYCIVAFGAKPDKGAFLLSLLRVGGIFAGGLLSVLLAVLVLPRSASVESLREMRKALKALHDLNREVWALSGVTGNHPLSRRSLRKHHRHGYSALQELEQQQHHHKRQGPEAGSGSGAGVRQSASDPNVGAAAAASASADGGNGLRRNALSAEQLDLLVQHDEELDSREAAVEKLFTAVYGTLDKVDEALGQTKGEIYIWHFWGRYFFLPGVHWFPARGRWQVPKKDVQDLATCLRRVARMLWTLLLDFEEGFGDEMHAVLQAYYPAQLLSELAEYQARAILDLLQAFPGGKAIEVDNLFTLGQVTDCLLQISDARARTAVFKMKRRRPVSAGPRAATAGLRTSRDHGSAMVGFSPSPIPAPGAAGQRAEAEKAEVELSRSYHHEPGLGIIADATSAAADHAAAALEKTPLLQQGALSSALSGASGGLTPPVNGARLRSARGSSSGSGAPGGGGGEASGGGAFISRLLSGQPGGHVALPLPPRRFLQGQSQAQRAQLPPQAHAELRPPAAGAAVLPGSPAAASMGANVVAAPHGRAAEATATAMVQHAAASECSDSVDADILGGLHFELSEDSSAASPSQAAAAPPPGGVTDHRVGPVASAPLSLNANAAAVACAGGYGESAHAPRPKPHPALPTIPSSQDLAQGVHGASDCGSASGSSPKAALASPFMDVASGETAKQLPSSAVAAGAETPERPVAASPSPGAGSVFASPANVPPLGGGGGGVASVGIGDFSVRSGGAGVLGGVGGGSLFGELSLMGSSIVGEPITFPPTEEGYLTQVRWYSFQFVMDELVNELEEAFCAASAVLRQLPHPVGA